jgi:hypothetical protein
MLKEIVETLARKIMRTKTIGFVATLVLILMLTFAATISAQDGETHGCHWNSGSEFGQHHAAMAQEGMLGANNNPGVHYGYSVCVP